MLHTTISQNRTFQRIPSSSLGINVLYAATSSRTSSFQSFPINSRVPSSNHTKIHTFTTYIYILCPSTKGELPLQYLQCKMHTKLRWRTMLNELTSTTVSQTNSGDRPEIHSTSDIDFWPESAWDYLELLIHNEPHPKLWHAFPLWNGKGGRWHSYFLLFLSTTFIYLFRKNKKESNCLSMTLAS